MSIVKMSLLQTNEICNSLLVLIYHVLQMAPKKSPAHKGEESSRTREQRSKGKKLLSTKRDPPSSKVLERKVLRPQAADFGNIYKYLPSLVDIICSQPNLDMFMPVHHHFYPCLVHEFYSNLTMTENNPYTIVQCQAFKITPAFIGNALGLLYGGYTLGDIPVLDEAVYQMMPSEEMGDRKIAGLNANHFPIV